MAVHKFSTIDTNLEFGVEIFREVRWPTGDMQHALSLAHTKSDCCTQNQKSHTNLLSMHKFKVDAHKFDSLYTKWVLQNTNSDLLHTKFCCSTQIEACCIQSGCCSMQRALLLLLCLLSLPINCCYIQCIVSCMKTKRSL